MFNKETYIARRAELKKLVKDGIILLFGNNESPVNSPANGYSPFRQDSSFLYYSVSSAMVLLALSTSMRQRNADRK